MLSRLLGRPVVLHTHGADFDEFYHRSPAFIKPFFRFIFSLCSRILVLSGFWRSFFIKHAEPKKVEILHNGVYASVFSEHFTAPTNLSRFLFLGRLGQRKGVYDLLQAIDILVNKERHSDLQFFLAGDGDIDEVNRIIAEKQLTQHVQLLGWLQEKEKMEWFRQVDTIVLPSYNEGLPMALLEAMAAGKIIISTRVGGIPDLVEDGKNGFLMTPGDIDKLCQSIVYVKNHPAEMITMAKDNQEKILQDYNLATINQQLFAIYREVLAEKSRRSS
jgi:glycosyltransferase involved in cell wall biosynthesis